MAHPAHYFLRFLLVTQDDISLRSLDSTLLLHGLAPVRAADFEIIHAEIAKRPEDLQLWNPNHQSSRIWLKKMRVFSLVHPDAATREMRDEILQKPRVRERVDTLILGNVPAAEASYRLQKLRLPLSALAIEEYRHYFWNPSVMSLSDWGEYFDADQKVEGSGRTSPTRTSFQNVLLCGPDLAKYKVGVEQQIDAKKGMEELQRELYFTFQEVRTLPLSHQKVEMLATLTRAIVRTDERISAGDQALQDTLKRFEKFKLLTDDAKTPTMAQLAPTGSVSSKSRAEILISREK